MNFDWKHIVAVAVGVVLSIASTRFGIDKTVVCGQQAPAIAQSQGK